MRNVARIKPNCKKPPRVRLLRSQRSPGRSTQHYSNVRPRDQAPHCSANPRPQRLRYEAIELYNAWGLEARSLRSSDLPTFRARRRRVNCKRSRFGLRRLRRKDALRVEPPAPPRPLDGRSPDWPAWVPVPVLSSASRPGDARTLRPPPRVRSSSLRYLGGARIVANLVRLVVRLASCRWCVLRHGRYRWRLPPGPAMGIGTGGASLSC
ncbi:hypothetical protein C8Q73DRAFT_308189 [Cubamyces lactineus]|nr:hypothetical protein C8Q73DRAFT_308189 [Cubamyces lactineus]